jgi:Na+/melibiose symporter-like transporter
LLKQVARNGNSKKLSASYVVIGVKEKIGYGLGYFDSNLSFGFVSLFLLFIYIAYTIWMAIAIYFIKYIIGNEEFTATFFTNLFLPQ